MQQAEIQAQLKYAAAITGLQSQLESLPQTKVGVVHLFAPGFYGRVAKLKADTLVVGKIHKTRHMHCLVSGTMRVSDSFGGVKECTGPLPGTTQPGTQRAAYAVTDCVFLTVHRTHKTSLSDIEDEVIAKSREELCLG